MGWLVWEEARARERSSLLAARLRAARERAQAGGAFCPEPIGPEAPGDGDDLVRGHKSGGGPEGVFCAKDAQKTREPHVPLRRGDVGAAQGGGAGKDASGGPQERPGPGLSKKAPALGAAPGVVSCEPLLRVGEKVASRRCSRLRKASAADTGEAGEGSAGTRAVPLPKATAARRGAAGPSGAAPSSDPEGEFFALRESVARAAARRDPGGRCSVGDVIGRRGDEFTSPPGDASRKERWHRADGGRAGERGRRGEVCDGRTRGPGASRSPEEGGRRRRPWWRRRNVGQRRASGETWALAARQGVVQSDGAIGCSLRATTPQGREGCAPQGQPPGGGPGGRCSIGAIVGRRKGECFPPP